MKHTSYARLFVGAVIVAAVMIGGVTGVAHAGLGSTLAKVIGKVAGVNTKTKCLNGEVISFSKKALTLKYGGAKGKTINKTLRSNSKQFDAAVARSIKRGTPVKICSQDNWKSLYGNIVSRVPKGLENTGYGNEDGGGGGGGGGHSGT